MQAMAMELPVISTNWSGIQAFLDEKVGYPIRVSALMYDLGADSMDDAGRARKLIFFCVW
jgi:hypothetical protein